MRYSVSIEVAGLDSMADPEGQTIERALPALGFEGVSEVRVGKVVRFLLESPDEASAAAQVEEMCGRLLANPVIETASVAITRREPDGRAGERQQAPGAVEPPGSARP